MGILKFVSKIGSILKLGSYKLSSDRAIDQADYHGWEVVPGHDRLLLIDIDSLDGLVRFHRTLCALAEHILDVHSVEYTRSKSGNWHLYVTVDKPIEAPARCTFQALLGSDNIRETLSYVQAIDNDSCPCLFWELPGNAKRSYKHLYDNLIGHLEQQWLEARAKQELFVPHIPEGSIFSIK